jgi:hypothetical protein
MVQFPWRLMQIFSFVSAVLCTVVVRGLLQLKSYSRFFLAGVIIVILLVNVSYSYRLSRQYITLRNPGRGSTAHLVQTITALNAPFTGKLRDVPEYRPLVDSEAKSLPQPLLRQPLFSWEQGKGEVKIKRWDSWHRELQIRATESSTIKIRTYYYPAWQLLANKQSYPLQMAEDGRIKFNLAPGFYRIELIYGWTWAFAIGVFISISCLFVLLLTWLSTNYSNVFRLHLIKF